MARAPKTAPPADDGPEDNIDRLRKKLRELFQLDRGDLDFGLYRIMALKRTEVGDFLDNELLPQIKEALEDIAKSDTAHFENKLKVAMEKAAFLELTPEEIERNKEITKIKNQIKSVKGDQQIEAETYNHLYNFFARYYDEGDFMSLRRYKSAGREAYSIPYNGEEVKLHWANADQYYIKTTENYSSYIFTVGKGKTARRVRFEIAAADNEKDNIKETNGKNRLFLLSKDFMQEKEAARAADCDLIIRFDHRPLSEGEKARYPKKGAGKQKEINKDTEQRIGKKLSADWKSLLFTGCPTEADEERTLLGKHITTYTAKNSFDYFIHKDLGGFLRRELDFYLKSEVLSIDNLELTDDPAVFIRGLAQLKAIKRVGGKIIDFLAQLEDFQKQLWLKKKFVLETQYCVTLDKVSESLYPKIIKNKAQCEEWVRLFAIDELKGDAVATAYSKPLKTKFLKENSHLVLDTRHFDEEFKDKLLAALSEAGPIEEQMNGLLVHGENFQALNLLQARYRGEVKCIYIDPPYNTDSSSILYKNDYKDSSWLSMMENRLMLSKYLLPNSGILCCAIDEEEAWRLRSIMQKIFEHELGIVPVRTTPAGRKTSERFSPTHEYAFFFGMNDAVPGSLPKTQKEKERYPFVDEIGHYAWNNLIRHGSGDKREDVPTMFYPIYVKGDSTIRVPKIKWEEHKRAYQILEKPQHGESVVWPVRGNVEKRWHRGWERVQKEPGEYRVRRHGEKISIDFRIRLDKNSMPRTWWDDNEYSSANHGTRVLKELFLESPFDFPKAVKLVENCLRTSIDGNRNAVVLDYFAGSGTTGHAAININHEDDGNLKYILVEVGRHFENVLLPRMKKVIYSKEWKNGKPTDRKGISQLFKYIRLESYEDVLDSLVVNIRKDMVGDAEKKKFIEDYKLRYALSDETAKSATILGEDFEDPYKHTLNVVRDGVRQDVNADIAETFNFLLGLCLTSHQRIDDVLAITGETSKGENCLILWRNTVTMNAEQLEKWFSKHCKTFGNNLNLIYINGDHTINTLKKPTDKWEAVTTEPVFRVLMFEEIES